MNDQGNNVAQPVNVSDKTLLPVEETGGGSVAGNETAKIDGGTDDTTAVSEGVSTAEAAAADAAGRSPQIVASAGITNGMSAAEIRARLLKAVGYSG